MNVIIIPFHDWRKSEREGFRTRDVHFIKAFSKDSEIEKILVINRPTTFLELAYNKQSKKINGEMLLSENGFTLSKVDTNIYVVDYHSKDIFTQIIKKHLWFIAKYNDEHYFNFIEKAKHVLKMETSNVVLQNVFAYKLAVKLDSKNKVFDAWDNFLKFPAYQKIKNEIYSGYKTLSENTFIWITNSLENVEFYKSTFKVENISLVKNGVKTDFIKNLKHVPEDLKHIQRPIIGFGGKISYLLNTDLINYLSADNPNASFVFVGQILDKEIFEKIEKRKNVYFLGDKHYDEYPNYVQNFDICIVPYNIREKQHGGDSIKAYEYLLTGKKVVGTRGNGLQDLEKHLYLVDSSEDFSSALKSVENNKPLININEHSWESKAKMLMRFFK
ncbi:putative glycosyltransferase (GT4) [Formosa agariphila KMM 3901]|uniref:Putative glycosyltransferase (GT4) n=1 Tax=Formosa agariphila (strain DSM 15362 / KCTC 12365 / LMG 23005 / KMM 3901 / M-2Alg 35-1) TaxID=1347342 RepID=T2KQU3_FORAG|nr:glycosyltransferase [Formosa agariphila]CDF81217.1 putative glycosyltransferase (GT4) [Formosa agariphila KMM 3901]